MPMQDVAASPARQRLRLAGAMVFLLLCAAVLVGLGDSFHSRLLYWGEVMWKDYYILNPNITEPACSTAIDVEQEVQRQMALAAEDSFLRSEERRVGKECASRWGGCHLKKGHEVDAVDVK